MNFIKDTKFFFTGFHSGSVNIILHVISVTVFIIGILNRNIPLAIIGLAVIDELGHIYNYFVHHKLDPKFNPIRMVPYQSLYVMPPAIIIFKIAELI